jgi:xanthine dehydrogenase small subunit
MRTHIRFIFRGQLREISGFRPTRTLLDWLREEERATGTKEGCNEGDCGACTVVLARLVEGQLVHLPVNACTTLLGMVDGAELITVEDLAEAGRLHPIQQAIVDHHGSQCGFCTPGIVMSLFALAQTGGPIDRTTIDTQLQGNLCRCTGYRPIADAAMAGCAAVDDQFRRRASERAARLAMLAPDDDALVPAEGGFFAVPRSVDSLAAHHAAHPDATLVAGATDVGLWITKQFRPLSKLIWLGRVEGFDTISETADMLTIGAGATHEQALPALLVLDPDLAAVGHRFGSKQVRAQGTVGGNIANGSPIGDWAPCFIALGAELELQHGARSAGGVMRRMPLENFFVAYGRQDRQPGEFVTALHLPKLGSGEHFRALKLSKRFDEDISAVMGAFRLTVVGGTVTAARVAFGGMAATPKRAPRTEAALAGLALARPATWRAAIAALAEDYAPIDDMRASAAYRREAAGGLLLKVLLELAEAAPTSTRVRPRLEEAHAA